MKPVTFYMYWWNR